MIPYRRFIVFVIFNLGWLSLTAQSNIGSKLKGGVEFSLFPIHKASLLGLTSTENPTIGSGFFCNYHRWSFYGTTFHEFMHDAIALSQFESNLTYNFYDGRNFGFSVFNTAISSGKTNTVFMIPTLSFAICKEKALKVNATPYTWGFNSRISGYTYSLLYDRRFGWNSKNLNFGFQSKFVYTLIHPTYTGLIEEFSPFLILEGVRLQTRCIYQNSTNHFIFDIGIQTHLNFN